MRLLPAISMLILLAACGPVASPTPLPTLEPTLPPLTGTVDIEYPQDGTVIYAEALYLSGTAQSVPGNQFTIRVVAPDDSTIAEGKALVSSEGMWTLELVHHYKGNPTETTILALPNYEGAPPGSDYDIASVVLADQSSRPEGTYGAVFLPVEGDITGGDVIQVSGMASGVFENEFRLELRGENGSVIASQNITLVNPYFMDEIPYNADLPTNGYTGPAEIHAFAISPQDGREIVLGTVRITITGEAG